MWRFTTLGSNHSDDLSKRWQGMRTLDRCLLPLGLVARKDSDPPSDCEPKRKCSRHHEEAVAELGLDEATPYLALAERVRESNGRFRISSKTKSIEKELCVFHQRRRHATAFRPWTIP
jgi:hypothetical protein